MRLLAAAYEPEGLFNADGESPMAKDIVLFTGEPTKTMLSMPRIHELRQQGAPWLEIHRQTGHSASCASDYYGRWCRAMGYAPA
jgi:hypothetical protein